MEINPGQRFFWGVATSAFQLEGSPYADWSAWDQTIGSYPDVTDHYHLYKSDLNLLKELGVNAYRFSLEWSRIEPEEGVWNHDALAHYQEVVDILRENDIEPFVTLHHFTHPRWFLEKHPWHEESSVARFLEFVEKVVSTLRGVRYWITFNEPYVLLLGGYIEGCMPPGKKDFPSAVRAFRNILVSHAEAYQLLRQGFSNASVGITHNMAVFAPCRGWNPVDRVLTRIAKSFYNYSLLDAFLTGRLKIRVPFKRPMTVELPIKGKLDFFGVNYYTRIHVRFNPFKNLGVELEYRDMDGNGLTDTGWEIYPDGLEKVLRYASRLNVPLFVTENGIATHDDREKMRFIQKHVEILERSRRNGLDIRGYFYWSLMDNYEWLRGFDSRFGLYRVDFDTLERKPTETAAYYSSLIRQKQ